MIHLHKYLMERAPEPQIPNPRNSMDVTPPPVEDKSTGRMLKSPFQARQLFKSRSKPGMYFAVAPNPNLHMDGGDWLADFTVSNQQDVSPLSSGQIEKMWLSELEPIEWGAQ